MTLVATDRPTILVLGATGQVGHALLDALKTLGPVIGASRTGSTGPVADLADPAGLRALVRQVRPQVIVNAAAYTAVDKAESDEAMAWQVNAEAPGLLAAEAKSIGAVLVHYSTDYVFDGSGKHARKETEATGPLNAYGRSKLGGEQAITAVDTPSLIFRTSWVFSANGQNFVNTMLKLGAQRETLSVVADQVGAPTSAAFLAAMTRRALVLGFSKGDFSELSGIYHLCCAGGTTWFEFAELIFAKARERGLPLRIKSVVPIDTADYPLPAQRPRNSRLDCDKFYQTFAEGPIPWQLPLNAEMDLIAAKV